MKEYYPHLDVLKGIAILLMVMGHVIAWSYPDWHFLTDSWKEMPIQQFNASFVWKIIYSFHMPLLFFVSGYLFYKKDAITFKVVKTVFTRRVQRLLIPYLTTGFFVLILKGYFGYWFFIVLFILNLIVLSELYLETKISLSDRTECFCHLFVFICLWVCSKLYNSILPAELANLAGLPQYYLLFIFGYLLHKYNNLEQAILSNKCIFISLLLYVAMMVFVCYFGIITFLGIFIPLFASSYLFAIVKNNDNKNLLLGGVKIAGKYSMEIYVFHLFFVIQIPSVGDYILTLSDFPTSIVTQLSYSLILSFIAITFSIIIAKIVKGNYYLAKLLFGK